MTVVISSALATLTPMLRTLLPPTKYFCTTPTGTMTWSSGFWKPVPPLDWRMPITWKGSPPMVTDFPMADASRPRLVAVVAPSTTTRSFWSTLTGVRNEPCQTS